MHTHFSAFTTRASPSPPLQHLCLFVPQRVRFYIPIGKLYNMDPEFEASSKMKCDSSTTSSSTSTSSTSNFAVISKPTVNEEDLPKLELDLAEAFSEGQTAESGFEEGPSFPAAEPVNGGETETTYGQGGASLFYVPQQVHVGKSYHILNTGSAAVILDNPLVNKETAFENEALADNGSKILVNLGEVVLPPLQALGNFQPIENKFENESENESAEIYSKDCLENDRIIRKTAVISKAHNFKMAYNYARYLTGNNLEVDAELCENEKVEKDLQKKYTEVQHRYHRSKTEIKLLRQEIAEAKMEHKAELQKKKDRMKYLKERLIIEKRDLEKIENEQDEVHLKIRDTKKGGDKKLRRQLSDAEQQIDMLQKRFQEKNAEAEELRRRVEQYEQIENAEVKELRRRIEQIENAEVKELRRSVEQILQLVQTRVPSCSQKQATKIDLNLTCNAVSSSESKKQSKRTGMESASVPVTAFREESVSRSTSHFAQLTIDSESIDRGDDELNAIPESLGSSRLDTEINEKHMFELAAFFDGSGLALLVAATQIFAHEKGDVDRAMVATGTQAAAHICLKCWRRRRPTQATFQALLTFVRRSGREDIAVDILSFFNENNY